MLLDWNNPPDLDAPKRRQTQQTFRDRLKLAAHHAKRAKGPKNHATNKERSFHDRMKAARIMKNLKDKAAAFDVYRAQVRAYWAGDRPNHPGPFLS